MRIFFQGLRRSLLLSLYIITGIDTNMCCGTHVSNLSHLQCIKLLHTESKKGSTLLYYIAGGRVSNYLERAYSNERTLNKLLRYIYR